MCYFALQVLRNSAWPLFKIVYLGSENHITVAFFFRLVQLNHHSENENLISIQLSKMFVIRNIVNHFSERLFMNKEACCFEIVIHLSVPTLEECGEYMLGRCF